MIKKSMILEDGRKYSEATKGEIIVVTELDTYTNKEFTLRVRVDRVNKNSLSVTCIEGYMEGAAWKISKAA